MTPDDTTKWVVVVDMDSGLDLLLEVLVSFREEEAPVRRLNLQTDGSIARLEVQTSHLEVVEVERLRIHLGELSGIHRVHCGRRTASAPLCGHRPVA